MEIEKLIKDRRTIHNYSTKVVPEAILKKAIELAIYAPNHRLTFPWKFFRADKKLRAELGEIAIEKKSAKASSPMTDAAKSAIRRKYNDEGTLIIAGITKNEDAEIEREDYASLSCGLQNMALYLWSEGYGTKWSSGKILTHPVVYKAIGESADSFTVYAFFWIGEASAPARLVPRPPLEKFYFEI